jgi:proline iminopeptidase
MFEFDHLDTLSSFTRPVLIIAGVHDPICPIEDANDMVAAARPATVTYHRSEHAGHTVAAADPDLFVDLVRNHLAATTT